MSTAREGEGDGRRSVLLLVVPSVLALIAVLALIGALLGVFGEPVDEDVTAQPSPTSSAQDDSEATPQTTNATPRTTNGATPSARADGRSATDDPRLPPFPTAAPPAGWDFVSGSGSSAGDASGSGAGSRSGSGTGAGSRDGSGKEGASGTATRPLPVYVLNQTTRRGLAAEVAEDIESAGWSVTKVSWWRGLVPSTTVYYPPGYESAAQALSDAFPAIDRIRPRVAPMPDDALTVILCKEYPAV